MAYAADAIEEEEPRTLYGVIDERSRHALISIVEDRKRAAEAIRTSYPPELQERALAALGDAALATDAADLFARRCGAACRAELQARIAPPKATRQDGDEVVVTTVRDTELRLYRRQPGHWYGIVWQTEALDRERANANRDLAMIRENGATYARRRELERTEETR